MFLDASAMVAILTREEGWAELSSKLDQSTKSVTSPLALWETLVALTRGSAVSFDRADAQVSDLLSAYRISIIPITAEIGALAIDASRRFGRGRHPAALNFGDCFAYAAARHLDVPLLFKGEDFPLTDIAAA